MLPETHPSVRDTQHGLGRIYHHDERDLAFPMQASLVETDTTKLPAYKYYTTGPILNQGSTPMCVGYSWSQFLTTSPIRQQGPGPEVVYCEAQKLDPWEGDCDNPLYDGTAVRAGAQALQARGFISTYVWSFDAETTKLWILGGHGPVVMGTMWYHQMFTPDTEGFLHVDLNDHIAGGHAYLLNGYSNSRNAFRLTNSWGKGWGQAGRAWLRYDDLAKLFAASGECCTATELKAASVASAV